MADDVNTTFNQETGAAGAEAGQAERAATGSGERVADAARAATDSLRQGAERARDAFQDHVVEPAKRAGEAMRASGQRIAEGGSTIGGRLIDQAEANAREAFSAMRAATHAKDLTEVMRIQGDYLREQGQRSMGQAREIGELIMQFGRDAVGAVRPSGGGEPPKA